MSKFPQIAILAKPVKHQVAATGHIERSLKAAGYRVRTSYDFTAPEDVVFCWGWGKAKEVRAVNPDAIICCMDHGYTKNRKQLINTGWSIPAQRFGLNGFAEHPWIDDGGKRARAMGWADEIRDHPIDPVIRGHRRALVLGQVYGDAMIVDHVEDYGQWLRDTIARLNEEGYETWFRPHPIMVQRDQLDRYGNLGHTTYGGPLEADLDRVDMVAAMNSNGLVQALIHGLPVRAWNKGTMLSPIMEGPGVTIGLDKREELVYRLAWAQWTYPELENGEWLKVHAPIMHRLVDGGPSFPWHDRKLD